MALLDTTLRDFGGGWNVADSDLNLSSKFQPISDNVIRGVDGSFGPRMGMGLWADGGLGTETTRSGVTLNLATTNTQPTITVTDNAHGYADGEHITISGITTDLNGIPFDEINGTHAIVVIDANSYKFHTRVAATSTASANRTFDLVHDDHVVGGNIIHNQYFNGKLLIFTDIGEVCTIEETTDSYGNTATTITRIWGAAEADAMSAGLVGTRRCSHWSSGTFKSTTIACNGYNRDKPIQIADDFTAEFLVDKATSSNSAVPKADFVICLQGFVAFLRTEYGNAMIEFSAKGTDGTFSRETSPADAIEMDLSTLTSTMESTLLGAAQIRDKLYVAFYDRGMIGSVGVYNGSDHAPDFSDTIAEHGTISHRTLVSLGNDIFMCDYAGVPSVSISQASGVYVPTRISELIGPALQKHLSQLSEETLRSKSFAVYDKSMRSYMLFLPIYDEVEKVADINPFLFNEELRELGYAWVRAPKHRLFENSNIVISGATSIGSLDAGDINGTRRVVSIVDEDNFIVELGDVPDSANDTSGGGTAVRYTPVNDETIGYVFEYNKEFKIRRWTRFRGWNFDCGCVSQRGRVFFAKGKKVYRMGDNEVPLYADFVGDYDSSTWSSTGVYTAGIRIRDEYTDTVFVCDMDHDVTDYPYSNTSGNPALDFLTFRETYPDMWSPYVGEPISWAMETPWSDMRERGRTKTNKYVGLDTQGSGRFTLSAFVNQIRRDPATNELLPYASMEFQAGNTGGFGVQSPGNWGGGRRTRDEKLWPLGFRGKLIRWRYEGETTERVRIISHTMYYRVGGNR